MPNMNQGVQLAVAILVVGVLTAFLLPVAIDSMVGTESTTLTQTEGNTANVDTHLNSTLDNVNNSNNDITVTVTDTDASVSQQLTNITQGNNQTATLDGSDVTVANDNVTSATEATVTYTYPRDFAFDDNTQSIWGIVPIFFVLAILLLVVGRAMDFM